MQTLVQKPEVLLVDDNPGDLRLTREALNDWRNPPRIRVAMDGLQALDFLHAADASGSRQPDLVILDLNLPGIGGHDVLRAIKSSPTLRHIPVIILSSSDSESDVRAAYELQANCYVVKPVSLDRFIQIVLGIEEFWLGQVRLPGNGGEWGN